MALSLLAIGGSSVALVYGWATAEPAFVWTSVGSSAVAAILMALGYARTGRETRRRLRKGSSD